MEIDLSCRMNEMDIIFLIRNLDGKKYLEWINLLNIDEWRKLLFEYTNFSFINNIISSLCLNNNDNTYDELSILINLNKFTRIHLQDIKKACIISLYNNNYKLIEIIITSNAFYKLQPKSILNRNLQESNEIQSFYSSIEEILITISLLKIDEKSKIKYFKLIMNNIKHYGYLWYKVLFEFSNLNHYQDFKFIFSKIYSILNNNFQKLKHIHKFKTKDTYLNQLLYDLKKNNHQELIYWIYENSFKFNILSSHVIEFIDISLFIFKKQKICL
jgi:hypothetical protein